MVFEPLHHSRSPGHIDDNCRSVPAQRQQPQVHCRLCGTVWANRLPHEHCWRNVIVVAPPFCLWICITAGKDERVLTQTIDCSLSQTNAIAEDFVFCTSDLDFHEGGSTREWKTHCNAQRRAYPPPPPVLWRISKQNSDPMGSDPHPGSSSKSPPSRIELNCSVCLIAFGQNHISVYCNVLWQTLWQRWPKSCLFSRFDCF